MQMSVQNASSCFCWVIWRFFIFIYISWATCKQTVFLLYPCKIPHFWFLYNRGVLIEMKHVQPNFIFASAYLIIRYIRVQGIEVLLCVIPWKMSHWAQLCHRVGFWMFLAECCTQRRSGFFTYLEATEGASVWFVNSAVWLLELYKSIKLLLCLILWRCWHSLLKPLLTKIILQLPPEG